MTTTTAIANHPETTPFLFAIGATFTAEPLRSPIAFWGKQLGAAVDIWFAPYNQLVQTLLDPASGFAGNQHGVNILLARLEDLAQFDASSAPVERIQANLQQLLDEIRTAPARFPVPLLFCLCPSSPGFSADPHYSGLIQTARGLIAAALEDTPGVQFVDWEQIAKLYPVDHPHSAEGERLGRIPYTEEYFAALGTALVRYTHALLAPAYKVIALDCDNTLWKGICGEDGPEGVELDPPRRFLQEMMIEQRDSGMLLTLASKNNEEDVQETFRVHPEMPLQLRHFVAARLNWDPKPENLLGLAEQLSLGLDSFIFVDDNPKECAEVQGALPEVLTLALPEDIERVPEFLRHVWAFDHPVVTEEDRNRSAYYQQEEEFGNEIRQAASLEQFMESLELRLDIRPVAEDKLTRVAQLTQRTNQFNLTTIRRTEPEIRALLQMPEWECFTVDVSDRFGHYGLVGVLLLERSGSEWRVDTALLSCRALGRGVEHRMFAWLGQTAVERGLTQVVVPFSPTAKNKPASQFLADIHFGQREPFGDGFRLTLPSGELAGLRWKAPTAPAAVASKPVVRKAQHRRAIDYAYIANHLTSPPQILAAMRSSTPAGSLAEGMSETEQQLARIWVEVLERPSVEPTDNFFDLGGHSLLAVLLLLRIKETFGVELAIDDVYSGSLTLAELAARIEASQLGDIDPEEYAALLAEIEGLSDEEARELLNSEGAGQA